MLKFKLLLVLLSIKINVALGQKMGYNYFTPDQFELYQRAHRACKKGDYSRSLVLFDSLVLSQPDHCRVIAMRSLALRGLRKYHQAITGFKNALSCFPTYLFVYEQLGHVYFDIEEFDSAEYYYNKALTLDQRELQYENYSNLSKVKSAKGEHNNAINYINKWISDCQQSVTPESSCSDVWYQRAKSYHHLEKDSLALIDVDRYLEIYSDDSLAIALKKNIEVCLLEN